MTEITLEEAHDTARRVVDGAMNAVYPDTTGRLRDLEVVAYATAQAARHAASAAFGPEHAMTSAYRDIADQAASRAYDHTDRRIRETLLPVAAGELLREMPR